METIAVALSGGVDSAVAAYLLKEKGFKVVGITLILNDRGSYVEDAKRVAKFLDIEHKIYDYSKEFKKTVIDYFFETYKHGQTPNPCVFCNRFAKFKFLIEKIDGLGIERLATGHYAKLGKINSKKVICKSNNRSKDQSYFLCFLNSDQIERVVFPLEDIKTKEDIKTLARRLKLPVAKKKESYEVCFINDDYRKELKKQLEGYGEGYFIFNGKRIKKHDGIFNYTVGQRKGIEIPYKEALYIEKIDTNTFDIYLCTREKLYKKHVIVKKINELFVPAKTFKATAKLRSMMGDEPCIVYDKKDRFELEFEEKQFAPAPGQVACVYYNNCVVLGGFIEDSF